MTTNAFIVTDSTVTIFTDGEDVTVDNTHVNYQEIIASLRKSNYKKALDLANVAKTVAAYGKGKVTVSDGCVFYKGEIVNNSLTTRILRMIKEGFTIDPMIRFLENLMENQSGRAVQELYRFLEANSLPITEDGHFLAYKNVSENYRDKRTGTFDNRVGKVCEMPRNKVMDDPSVTCSTGLHVCSISYLNGFWGHGGHTMIVKVHPRDVVSVPYDYDNAKMRVCRYEVIAEHKDGAKDTVSERSVWYHNRRDASGRFVSAA